MLIVIVKKCEMGEDDSGNVIETMRIGESVSWEVSIAKYFMKPILYFTAPLNRDDKEIPPIPENAAKPLCSCLPTYMNSHTGDSVGNGTSPDCINFERR